MEEPSVVSHGPEQPRERPWGLLAGGLALVFVILMCSGVFGGNKDTPDYAEKADAERVCEEEFIANRLKAPSTAEFDLDVSGGPTTYTVSGTVDAQNSFGAMLRMEVTCVVTNAGDQWNLDSLTGIK